MYMFVYLFSILWSVLSIFIVHRHVYNTFFLIVDYRSTNIGLRFLLFASILLSTSIHTPSLLLLLHSSHTWLIWFYCIIGDLIYYFQLCFVEILMIGFSTLKRPYPCNVVLYTIVIPIECICYGGVLYVVYMWSLVVLSSLLTLFYQGVNSQFFFFNIQVPFIPLATLMHAFSLK